KTTFFGRGVVTVLGASPAVVSAPPSVQSALATSVSRATWPASLDKSTDPPAGTSAASLSWSVFASTWSAQPLVVSAPSAGTCTYQAAPSPARSSFGSYASAGGVPPIWTHSTAADAF